MWQPHINEGQIIFFSCVVASLDPHVVLDQHSALQVDSSLGAGEVDEGVRAEVVDDEWILPCAVEDVVAKRVQEIADSHEPVQLDGAPAGCCSYSGPYRQIRGPYAKQWTGP